LLVDAVVMGGYALQVVHSGRNFEPEDLVRMAQLGSIAAAVWAIGWLASRRWVATWREEGRPVGRGLMTAQVALIVLGNAALLVGGIYSLAGDFPFTFHLADIYYSPAPWAIEVGSWPGWLALLAGCTAIAQRGLQLQKFPDGWSLGWMALGVAVLVACTIERWVAPATGWGYRTLMVGCSLAALGSVVNAALLAGQWRLPGEGTPPARSEPALVGVLVAGMLALILGLKAAIWHHDHLWAATAILIAAVAIAIIAVWQRQEPWAFVAGLGLNLAASLVIWHHHLGVPVAHWWHYLLQASGAASGAAALLWLTARNRFYGTLELRFSVSPMLALQVLLAYLGNLPLLGFAVAVLLVAPDPGTSMLAFLAEVGGAGGWLAIALPLIGGIWYAAQATPSGRLPLSVVLILSLGVVASCSACRWDTGNWLAFHVLMTAWSTTGLGLLGLGLASSMLQLSVRQAPRFPDGTDTFSEPEPERSGPDQWLFRLIDFPADQVRRWVEAIGWLAVILGLRGAGSDVGGWFWAPCGVLTVAVMMVGMALWARRNRYVYLSGLLAVVVGQLLFLAGDSRALADFIAVTPLSLAFASVFWSVLEWVVRRETGPLIVGPAPRFTHLACGINLAGFTVLLFFVLVNTLNANPLQLTAGLTWAALSVTALAILLTLDNRYAPGSAAGLYLLGLQAVLFFLHDQTLLLSGQPVSMLVLPGPVALALAGYVLLISSLAATISRFSLNTFFPIRAAGDSPAAGWFLPAQTILAATAFLLSLWTVLDHSYYPHRWLAPLAVLSLVAAGVLTAWTRGILPSPLWRRGVGGEGEIRYATLALVVVFFAEIGWALLPADLPVLWLHRHVVLLTAAALMGIVYGVVQRFWPETWADEARRLQPVLMVMSALLVLLVLGQELASFDSAVRRAPVEPWAVAVVGAALLAMVGSALFWALRPDRDPLQLPDARRTFHVYAAEVLLALLFGHVKLTIPFAVGPHWPFIMMAIAFAGVGLAELFHRRGIKVLAEPLQTTGLFLPIFPLVAIWLRPSAELALPLSRQHLPGAEPFLLPMASAPQHWDRYAVLWVLTAVLWSLVALSRRSFRFAVVAALAGNFALWSVWQHHDIPFVLHPQAWLIPLGLILLVSEHLNRDRLDSARSFTLRYLGLGLIYLSSTADLFITGLGNSMWLPLVLMVLAVLGMLLGILLQVRAYLFLGCGFLFLDIFSMIWHAAVDLSQTWVWWVSGIVLGIAILGLFAVFEKRRNDVLRVVEQLKQWQA
jgi:hypothetical protein